MPEPSPRHRPVFLRPVVWIIYALLFGIAIPWYWSDDGVSVLFGMPLWAAVSVGTTAIISIYTAWLLIQFWPDDDEDQ